MLMDILERVNQSRKKALQNPHFVEQAKRTQKDIQDGKLKYRRDGNAMIYLRHKAINRVVFRNLCHSHII